MIPAPPKVGDSVLILVPPFETGVVERVAPGQPAVVDVRVAAGHVVQIVADDVRVVGEVQPL